MMRITLHSVVIVLAAMLLCCCTGNKSNKAMNNQNDFLEASPVMIDDTTVAGLIVYYPQFSRIDLVCETMPSKQDTNVIFCAEAAFTHELLDEFAHSNIDGDHVSSGQRY